MEGGSGGEANAKGEIEALRIQTVPINHRDADQGSDDAVLEVYMLTKG